jgi:hypothetical protein
MNSLKCPTRRLFLTIAFAGLGQLVVVPRAAAEEQYYRLQLKHGGQYLDADHCSNKITLNPGSDWEDGACQLWRLIPPSGSTE